jgi:hypothetical protein
VVSFVDLGGHCPPFYLVGIAHPTFLFPGSALKSFNRWHRLSSLCWRRLLVHEPQGLTTTAENLRMAGTEGRPTGIFI